MARYNKVRGHAVYVSRNLARRIIPILRWIEEAAPKKREKDQAASILKKIQYIEDWRQIILTKGELELLGFIRKEFPEGVPPEEGEQIALFTISAGRDATSGPQPSPSWKEKGWDPPIVREVKPRPILKKELTEEEQTERENLGLPRLGLGQKGKE